MLLDKAGGNSIAVIKPYDEAKLFTNNDVLENDPEDEEDAPLPSAEEMRRLRAEALLKRRNTVDKEE